MSINGLPAYVAFISSGQINALVPDDPTVGKVPAVVTNAQGASNAYMATNRPSLRLCLPIRSKGARTR